MAGRVTRIALAGEGGQGVQVVGEMLTEAAYAEGKEAVYLPNFGLEQRGGVSIAFVQISDAQIGSPKFKVGDIVVALSERAIRRMHMHTGPETLFVYDTSIEGAREALPSNAGRVVGIPALEVAKRDLHPRVFNMIVMGAVIGLSGAVSPESAQKALESKLGYKFAQNPALRELNFKALQCGRELAEKALQG